MIGSIKKFYGMINKQSVDDGYKWFFVEVFAQHSEEGYYCKDNTGRIFEAWSHQLKDLDVDDLWSVA